jgi:serine/threonine protein phosphatase 1
MSGRTLVIGDIHGMYEELIRVLEYAGVKDSDRLIFLGDYINRGKQSREVIDFLLEVKKNPNHVFLRGNHEEMILQLTEGNTDCWYVWLGYGEGRSSISSYGTNPDDIQTLDEHYVYIEGDRTTFLNEKKATEHFISKLFPEKHLTFFRETAVSYEMDRFFFSHAGIETGIPLSEQGKYTREFLLWGDVRHPFSSKSTGPSTQWDLYRIEGCCGSFRC